MHFREQNFLLKYFRAFKANNQSNEDTGDGYLHIISKSFSWKGFDLPIFILPCVVVRNLCSRMQWLYSWCCFKFSLYFATSLIELLELICLHRFRDLRRKKFIIMWNIMLSMSNMWWEKGVRLVVPLSL